MTVPLRTLIVEDRPDDARLLLKREIATAESECDNYLLRWISEHATAPVVNEVAVEALNDADPRTVLDALRYLTSYGTKADEKPKPIEEAVQQASAEVKDQPAADFVMGHEAPGMARLYREGISDERLKAVSDHVRKWLFSDPAV